MTLSTLAARMKRALAAGENRGLNQAGLARACGIREPSVSAWFSGDTKSLKGENAVLAARYLGVNPEWLTTGRGPMIEGDPVPAAEPEHAAEFVTVPEGDSDPDEWADVDFYPTAAAVRVGMGSSFGAEVVWLSADDGASSSRQPFRISTNITIATNESAPPIPPVFVGCGLASGVTTTAAICAPQCGHAAALSLTCPPHSPHFVSAISFALPLMGVDRFNKLTNRAHRLCREGVFVAADLVFNQLRRSKLRPLLTGRAQHQKLKHPALKHRPVVDGIAERQALTICQPMNIVTIEILPVIAGERQQQRWRGIAPNHRYDRDALGKPFRRVRNRFLAGKPVLFHIKA